LIFHQFGFDMNELELIEKLSRAISDNISGASVPLDKRPWSAAQCADYLGIEVNTFHTYRSLHISPAQVFIFFGSHCILNNLSQPPDFNGIT